MLSSLEEKALIARCMAFDDRAAFGKLVDAHAPDLRRFLLGLTGDPMLTDDLAQETFIKAYRGIRNFHGLSKFRTWLYRIAYREFYNELRQRHPSLDLDTIPEVEADDNVALTDTRYDIQAALRILPAVERTLVLLFYMEDRPLKEVVKITGIPLGTVKSYLSRARMRLASYFDNEESRSDVLSSRDNNQE